MSLIITCDILTRFSKHTCTQQITYTICYNDQSLAFYQIFHALSFPSFISAFNSYLLSYVFIVYWIFRIKTSLWCDTKSKATITKSNETINVSPYVSTKSLIYITINWDAKPSTVILASRPVSHPTKNVNEDS